MKTHLIPILVAALAAGTLSSCAATAESQVSDDSVPALPPYDGPKALVLIDEFGWGVGGEGADMEWQYDDGAGNVQSGSYRARGGHVTSGMEQSLKMSLKRSNRFECIDRRSVDRFKEERKLFEEGYIDPSTEVEKGRLKSPDILVRATVTEWDDNSGGSTVAGGGFLGRLGSAVGGVLKKEEGTCAIQLELIDLRTMQSIDIVECRGTAEGFHAGGAGFTWGASAILGGGMTKYAKKPMGKAIKVAIAQAVQAVVENVPEEYFKH